jgi:type II protein arginine methyltransferase
MPPVAIQSRWYSEPVRVLTLDSKIFTKNAKGYPVLTKAHQALISRFVRLRTPPWFLLCDVDALPASKDGGTVFTNGNAYPTLAEANANPMLKDPTPHLSYMRNLQAKQPISNPLDKFGNGYQDYLQAPLQPLTVNLESITYEVFEKDPVKYAWYEKAIASALSDWHTQHKPTSNSDGRIVVAVVGAGRGPLVTRALNAAESTGVPIDMWALEKNPNAFVLLQRHNATIWGGRVNLVKSDMRTWRGPLRKANMEDVKRLSAVQEANPISPSATFTGSPNTDSTYLLATATQQAAHYKVDILISELLGSFADNELSPECLDGVQHLINPVHGISVPQNYTAFISPVAAPKLHADISNSMTASNAAAAETPYVVMLNAIDHLSTTEPHAATPVNGTISPPKDQPQSPLASHPPNAISYSKVHQRPTSTLPPIPKAVVKPTWSFTHPNPLLPAPSSSPSNVHNARYTYLTFPIPNRSTLHGLAGYFESVLYPASSSSNTSAIELSTNPLTMEAKSPDMISWFPIYFPLRIPVYVPDNGEVGVAMWRRTDERKVWYEWKVDVYARLDSGKGKSSGDRKIRIGGSELHSSEKEACLM